MKKLRNIMIILGLVAGFGLLVPSSAFAASALDSQCAQNTDLEICANAKKDASPGTIIKNIVTTLLFVVGAISVVMLIVGGLLYATSTGDSGRVSKAKNTVTYAIVGLAVSFFAFAIVQFVVTKFI